MMYCARVLCSWAKMYNGAVCGAEHGLLFWPWLMALWWKTQLQIWGHHVTVSLEPAQTCLCLCVWVWTLFKFNVCVSMAGPATARHPALHLSNEMPHRESPSRAITHHAWPFLNNFINIPWASLNRAVWKVMARILSDADSIKARVATETWRDN